MSMTPLDHKKHYMTELILDATQWHPKDTEAMNDLCDAKDSLALTAYVAGMRRAAGLSRADAEDLALKVEQGTADVL